MPKGRDKVLAKRLRARLRAQKAITPEQQAWLTEWDQSAAVRVEQARSKRYAYAEAGQTASWTCVRCGKGVMIPEKKPPKSMCPPCVMDFAREAGKQAAQEAAAVADVAGMGHVNRIDVSEAGDVQPPNPPTGPAEGAPASDASTDVGNDANTSPPGAGQSDEPAPERPEQPGAKSSPRQRVGPEPADAPRATKPPPAGGMPIDFNKFAHEAAIKLARANEEIAKEGVFALGPDFWFGFWEPCAAYCLGSIFASMDPRKLAWPVFVAGPAQTIGCGLYAADKARKRKQTEVQPPRSPQSAPEAPRPEQAAAANGPARPRGAPNYASMLGDAEPPKPQP